MYLIDGYKTSKLCNIHELQFMNKIIHTEKLVSIKYGKFYVISFFILIKKIFCSNKNCKICHDRDINFCMNMHKIVMSYKMNNNRPKKKLLNNL